uniref:Uncharacterized protein n=1 Tax=Moniliophthora roreri TaxID=221103 RepID=A0A0W0G079_MONRR
MTPMEDKKLLGSSNRFQT